MELRLTVEGSPPSGLLHRGAEPPLPFAGWLELLRVLSLTFEDGGADPAALDPGGRVRASAAIVAHDAAVTAQSTRLEG